MYIANEWKRVGNLLLGNRREMQYDRMCLTSSLPPTITACTIARVEGRWVVADKAKRINEKLNEECEEEQESRLSEVSCSSYLIG